jgi:hypothetical protein
MLDAEQERLGIDMAEPPPGTARGRYFLKQQSRSSHAGAWASHKGLGGWATLELSVALQDAPSKRRSHMA